ncbi:MAG: YwbE family protein [Polaribacter sp.]|nr:YwbE family protein [Polaribacter sp.]
MDGRKRTNVNIGMFVEIILKQHQISGELTQGVVSKILTKSVNHPHGIKVQLQSGLIGRVKNVIE